MRSALAAALNGAAASQMGDRSRAEYGFDRARDILSRASQVAYPHDVYGSLLRDLSGTLALAAENGKADLVPVDAGSRPGRWIHASKTPPPRKKAGCCAPPMP